MVLLPAGVAMPSQVQVRVPQDSCTFQLDVKAPTVATEPSEFLKLFECMDGVRHALLGADAVQIKRPEAFHKAFMGQRIHSTSAAWNAFKVSLPFDVVEDLLYSNVQMRVRSGTI